jgi:hypothetical protein
MTTATDLPPAVLTVCPARSRLYRKIKTSHISAVIRDDDRELIARLRRAGLNYGVSKTGVFEIGYLLLSIERKSLRGANTILRKLKGATKDEMTIVARSACVQ